MNIHSFIENLIAGIVCTAVCALFRRLYLYIKAAKTSISPPKSASPAKTLQAQFLVSLFVLVVSLPAAFMLPISKQPTLLGFLRVFLFIVSGLAFLIVWGAFDAAFAFYPKDDGGKDVPPKSTSQGGTED